MNFISFLKIFSVTFPAINAAILSSGYPIEKMDPNQSEPEVLYDSNEGIYTYHRPRTSFLMNKHIDSNDYGEYVSSHDGEYVSNDDEVVYTDSSSDYEEGDVVFGDSDFDFIGESESEYEDNTYQGSSSSSDEDSYIGSDSD